MAQDLKTLIPQTRRAIDGPAATAPDAPSTTLDDDQVKALIADAVAELIFHTGGLFGHELVVTGRDDAYNAPDEWEVDPDLELPEATVIVSQAALNHFFHVVRDLKVQEAIRDEGGEWSYSLSAQLLVERMRYLIRLRDDSLAKVEAQHPIPTVFVSILHERDRLVAEAVEPYYSGVLMP